MPKIPGWEKAEDEGEFKGEGWVNVRDDYGREIDLVVYWQDEDGTWLVEVNKIRMGIGDLILSVIPLLNATPDQRQIITRVDRKQDARKVAIEFMKNHENGWNPELQESA